MAQTEFGTDGDRLVPYGIQNGNPGSVLDLVSPMYLGVDTHTCSPYDKCTCGFLIVEMGYRSARTIGRGTGPYGHGQKWKFPVFVTGPDIGYPCPVVATSAGVTETRNIDPYQISLFKACGRPIGHAIEQGELCLDLVGKRMPGIDGPEPFLKPSVKLGCRLFAVRTVHAHGIMGFPLYLKGYVGMVHLLRINLGRRMMVIARN